MFRSTKFGRFSMAPRRNRRVMVVAVYFVIALLPLAQAFTHPTELYRTGSFMFAMILMLVARYVFGAIVPESTFDDRRLEMANTSGLEIVSVTTPERNRKLKQFPLDPEPDERDIAVRNSIYFRAFRGLAIYSVLIWFATTAFLNPHMPYGIYGMVIIQYATFPLMVMACTLPQAMILWNEPDLPEEA